MTIRGWRLLVASLMGAGATVSFSGCDFESSVFATLQCLGGDQQACGNLLLVGFDRDHDGVSDDVDNCPGVANPDQADGNHNGSGDVCEGSSAPTSPALPSSASITLKRGGTTVRGSFTITKASFGKVSGRGGKFHGNRGRASGTFVGPRTTTLSPIAPPLRGTWRSKLSFQLNSHTHRASARGHLVIKFKKHQAGKLCLAFNTRYTIKNGKLDVRGKFRVVGGTGDSAKIGASGRFVSTQDQGKSWTMDMTGKERTRSARRMPRVCRAV